MPVFIGSEHIIIPLGIGASQVYQNIFDGKSSIKSHPKAGFNGADIHYSSFDDSVINCQWLIETIFHQLSVSDELKASPRTKVVICSTKGNIKFNIQNSLASVLTQFNSTNPLANKPILISNACISGVLGIIKAAELIRHGYYDHVIVIGADVISPFIIYGFESLFALENGYCRPYDKARKGINLGSGAAAVVLSKDKNSFKETPLEYISGSCTNDANHISGPSKNGEGLFRSVQTTLQSAQFMPDDIHYISAHGTATIYNDNMESVAFSRLQLTETPLNSFKAYIGHTLGAAGVIETALAMQSLRTQSVVKCLGFENQGTDFALNVITSSSAHKFKTVLKTASGFGGTNASLIIKISE